MYTVEVLHQENLTVTFATIAWLRAFSRLANLNYNNVSVICMLSRDVYREVREKWLTGRRGLRTRTDRSKFYHSSTAWNPRR